MEGYNKQGDKMDKEIENNKKPNFFMVGGMKCGSSSLYCALKSHPNIFFPTVRGTNFFNDRFKTPSDITTLESFEDLFKSATSDHIAIGENTGAYLYSPVAIHNIYKYNKDAKLIIMLRNPIDVAYSRHSELCVNGDEGVNDFETAWGMQELRKDIPILQYKDYVKFGEYVEKVLDIFPRNQIKCIFFEDLVKDFNTVYEDVLKFLDVPSDGRIDFPIHHQNSKLRIKLVDKILRAIPYKSIKGFLGIGDDIIIPKLLELNKKRVSRKRLRPEFRAKLMEEFKSDIEKLSRLVNRDLSGWK